MNKLEQKNKMKTRIVGTKYRCLRQLGSGSFGVIYLGEDMSTGKEVAIKVESRKSEYPQLRFESLVYEMLQKDEGIPHSLWFGCDSNHFMLVMDLLGPSLEDLFDLCNRRFSLKTVLMIAQEILNRIQLLHYRGFIHRDVKPENFLIGLGRHASVIHLIDFGLAKRYQDSKTGAHLPYREDKQLTGTPRYASINNHVGIEQSRRDDLESVGYVLMYFLRGSLPWQGLHAKTAEEKYERILDTKVAVPYDVLCMGYPHEFEAYFKYCLALRFDETPDYAYLQNLFRGLMRKQGYDYDSEYDWVSIGDEGTDLGTMAYADYLSEQCSATVENSRRGERYRERDMGT